MIASLPKPSYNAVRAMNQSKAQRRGEADGETVGRNLRLDHCIKHQRAEAADREKLGNVRAGERASSLNWVVKYGFEVVDDGSEKSEQRKQDNRAMQLHLHLKSTR